ncbi:Ig-like domain-containing protein [Umezawaea endophytica]|uniref:Ig-like domain-containing protein n=1 Tax=Umezawaea endophytica TaxID=1654476 RepID=A0A9X2VW27_9PSEU|nr:Ig-like domain-containing protein [Umezawaea endophytica]MCS7483084.1 Ig-like domain-containing protein [Umezawaea endophytica]
MNKSLAAAVALAVGVLVAGCGSGGEAASPTAVEQQAKNVAVQAPMTVSTTPANGSEGVSPAGPFQVAVTEGKLVSVALTNAEGKQVAGAPAADGASWVVSEPLGYGKTYTWTGTAVGKDGKEAPITGAFTTVTPTGHISGSFNVGDDQTYGIAMPVAIEFSAPVTDRASVQKALKIETSVPTEGAWAWLSDTEVHWRPKAYWTPGTTVKVNANLYGVPHGDGAYGSQDVSVHFTIGRALIATADTQTHRFVVTKDGQQLFDFPASYGLESDPGRVSRSGIHVVISKSAEVSMTNQRYNYENVKVPWGVQISYNGEYVHGYEGSRYAQGSENVSHGCANLAPENAKLYFDEVIPGDPVNVVGSSVALSEEDRTYYDWTLDWNAWVTKGAV